MYFCLSCLYLCLKILMWTLEVVKILSVILGKEIFSQVNIGFDIENREPRM